MEILNFFRKIDKRTTATAMVVIILAILGLLLWKGRTSVVPVVREGDQKQWPEEATTTVAVPVAIPVKKTTATNSVQKTTTSAVTVLKDGSYLVSYTDHGFVPATLEIKTGKSVHFVNNSNKAMSLTTTTPDDQVYGEFNQSKTVGKGGAYDFTFIQPGTWSYRNRNSQGDTGVVIVK